WAAPSPMPTVATIAASTSESSQDEIERIVFLLCVTRTASELRNLSRLDHDVFGLAGDLHADLADRQTEDFRAVTACDFFLRDGVGEVDARAFARVDAQHADFDLRVVAGPHGHPGHALARDADVVRP